MFGNRVRIQRIRFGWSQDDLAQRAGLDVKTIGNIETGRTKPRPSTMRLIIDALQLDGHDHGDLQGDASTEAGLPEQPATPPTPAQLPANVATFTGRRIELTRLDALLTDIDENDPSAPGAEHPTAVVVSAVSGTAGVGKTALAVHWAHRVADRFPDGQLYVDLRGFGPHDSAVAPAEALRRFLNALHVPPQRIPTDTDAQAALFRSQLAERRMLIVLDNARDSGQVRPLLPGTAGCLVLVTSRNQLPGLIADGAHFIDLNLLAVAEARQLLARHLGSHRVAAEPAAVHQIITRCARLPLALALVAARATTRPRLALQDLARELADARQRWQTLTGDDPHTDVRAVFSWSYQALTPAAARLFRLLGLHCGPDISAPAAASLAGLDPGRVGPLLAELTQASLLAESTPGRYAFHDLLRDYARQLAEATDSDPQRHAATGRLLDHYLHTAHPAARLLDPTHDPILLAPVGTAVTAERLGDQTQAWDWFTVERPMLLAAVKHAAATGFDAHAWQLAWTLWSFLERRGHWHDQTNVGRAAVAATQRLADPTAQVRSHRLLASAYIRLGRYDDAHTQLRQALDLATRTGDQTGQAHTHYVMTFLWMRARPDQPRPALHHARQALRLHEATGHQIGQARALNAVGWCHAQLGEHQQALTYSRQALTLHQQLGDLGGEANAWDCLGYAGLHLGQHSQALACYQRALTLYQDVGGRDYQAGILVHIGDIYHATSRPDAARDAWRQALTILDDLDHPDAEQVHSKLAQFNVPRPHKDNQLTCHVDQVSRSAPPC